MKLRKVTQLELEQFAEQIQEREELSGGKALSAQEVRERSMAARMALGEKFKGGQELPSWASCYHRLINASWPWRMAAFVAWASMPKALRWPDTQEKLATEVLGLTSDRQIAEWRKKNPAIDQMIADLQADELLEARADVFAAVKDVAIRHDYKSGPYARMYLEMTNDLPSRLSVTMQDSAARSLLKMSDADLLNLSGEKAKEMLERLRAEQEEAADEPGTDE